MSTELRLLAGGRGARGPVLPVLLALLLSAGALGGQERMSLDEAIMIALARSPSYVQAEITVDNAHESRRTARGAYLPTLNASSSGSMRPGTAFDPTTQLQVSTTNRSLSGGINLGYDLYTGGRQRAELERAGADLEAAGVRLDGQRFQVIHQTKQLFFNALRQGDLLSVSEGRVRRAEENLEVVRQRVGVGTATASDSLRARLELTNARQAALQAETQARAARMALGRQVGIPQPVEAIRPTDLDPSPLPLPEAEIFRIAETSAHGVRASELGVAASQAQLASARAAYLPTVRLASGYNWSNGDWGFSGGDANWGGLSLSLNYSIFNGFSREATVQRAENQVTLARVQEEDVRLQARQETDAALHAIRTAEQAVAIAEEAVAMALEDLRIMQERYEVGVGTQFEVITSQISLDQAEVDRVTARYDYLLARADLESILGREL